jgi:hypothetical protein
MSIFIPMKAALGLSDVLTVTVNGTAHLAVSANLKSLSSFTYFCAPFQWTESGVMTVSISQSAGTVGVSIGDSPYVATVVV